MSDDMRPRVDAVVGDYFRKGKCEVCGKHCERLKTIRALSYDDMVKAADAWGQTPLTHKRCEGMPLRKRREVETVETTEVL